MKQYFYQILDIHPLDGFAEDLPELKGKLFVCNIPPKQIKKVSWEPGFVSICDFPLEILVKRDLIPWMEGKGVVCFYAVKIKHCRM